jgi:hypothetical protein
MAMTAREAWLAMALTLVACGSSPHGDPFAALGDMPPCARPIGAVQPPGGPMLAGWLQGLVQHP